ncbi:MAG: xylose isomerase [bacterium]|nr:xylose isomerase [bacterium]
MAEFFTEVSAPIQYEGLDTTNPLAFRVYDPDRIVAGKRLEDHLRMAVCYWHSFAWPGSDIFGDGTFDRPWINSGGDEMAAARLKMDAAFEFFSKLGTPYFCFHDRDIAPDGADYGETVSNLHSMVDYAAEKMEQTGVKLLWGTANVFTHPRFAAGASTNPNPEAYAFAASQVRHALEATKRLGGESYVLWGGREGYETLLNTDLKQEGAQLARFLEMVAEHKRKIGFTGQLFLEPKPQEPTKHQYDYDSATVHGFLERFDLVDEYQVNIEVNHATLAGHSFHHEVVYAVQHGIFGSVDANRGDPQNGWDTDQFPNSVEELVPPLHEIFKAGGFIKGGFNFDTKLRRQSMDRTDLFHGHIGGIDTLAKAAIIAFDLIEKETLTAARRDRYAGWQGDLGKWIMSPEASLEAVSDKVLADGIDPKAVSGKQEALENLVNRAIWSDPS